MFSSVNPSEDPEKVKKSNVEYFPKLINKNLKNLQHILNRVTYDLWRRFTRQYIQDSLKKSIDVLLKII